jgi:hypothetical protein
MALRKEGFIKKRQRKDDVVSNHERSIGAASSMSPNREAFETCDVRRE